MKLLATLLLSLALVTPALAGDDAQSAAAHHKKGMALKTQGKDDEAIAEFEAALALDPDIGMAWAALGHLYKKKQERKK
jgi:Tfp pilus assembly protein PilF